MPQPPIISEGRNCWRRTRSGRVAFLVDGAAYFSALAATMEKAEESIVMLGWDFDSRTPLRPQGRSAGLPDGFAPFIADLLDRKPHLRVYILGWDFAMVYAFEREIVPLFGLGVRGRHRLEFRLDGDHPFGGSHHQKIVVVDNNVAFSGGFDITRSRWDTPDHRARDPRRVDPGGKPYPPFHDVQIMVDGEAARDLGELAGRRWLFATGEELPASFTTNDPWPDHGAPVHARDAYVAISRTEPAYMGRPEVREVEMLFLDSIAAAHHSIYIENQYVTSLPIARALALRLEEKDGPEVVLVTPREPTGLLEEATMGVLRSRVLAFLKEKDRYGRLHVYYPLVPGLAKGQCVNVHSKVMVVDDAFVRIGSANLTNRSMGLDTECDISIEADGSEALRKAIVAFRNRLVAEHLGRAENDVAGMIGRTGSLASAVRAMSGGPRSLEILDTSVPEWLDDFVPESDVLDPVGPIRSERLYSSLLAGEEEPGRHPFVKAGLLLAAFVSLALLWHYGPLRDWFSLRNVEAFIMSYRDSLAAPLVVTLAFAVGSVLMVPLTLMIMACVLAFEPPAAFAYGLCGGMAAGAVGFWLGRLLGRDLVKKLAGKRIALLTRRLAQRGVRSILLVRMVPLLPFTVTNLAAGASGVRFLDFLAGTALGLCPGLLAMSLLSKGLENAILRPGVGSAALLLGIALLALLALRSLRKALTSAAAPLSETQDEKRI